MLVVRHLLPSFLVRLCGSYEGGEAGREAGVYECCVQRRLPCAAAPFLVSVAVSGRGGGIKGRIYEYGVVTMPISSKHPPLIVEAHFFLCPAAASSPDKGIICGVLLETTRYDYRPCP